MKTIIETLNDFVDFRLQIIKLCYDYDNDPEGLYKALHEIVQKIETEPDEGRVC
jgi:aromatic ring-opening dioxygenase catalytic subunit (LigB family)